MVQIVLLVLMCASALVMFATIWRAGRFAATHAERLPQITDRASWWLRLLFVKDGFGAEAEAQRQRFALIWILSAAGFFLSAATLYLSAS